MLQLMSAGSVRLLNDVTIKTASASRSITASLLKKSHAVFSSDIFSICWHRSSISHSSSRIWVVHSPTPPTRGVVVAETREKPGSYLNRLFPVFFELTHTSFQAHGFSSLSDEIFSRLEDYVSLLYRDMPRRQVSEVGEVSILWASALSL